MPNERIHRLLDRLAENHQQGVLLHKPSNIRYFSGYLGEGILLITPDLLAILTDFRYTEQAEREAPGFAVQMVEIGQEHAAAAFALLKARGLAPQNLAFEDDAVTVAQMRKLEAALPGIALTPVNRLPEILRERKAPEEAEAVEQACILTARAFDRVLDAIRPGVTERAIALAVYNAFMELGAQDLAFPSIIASGPNGALPHAVPGERSVQRGDFVTLDIGAKLGGYCADFTRTVALGSVTSSQRHLYETVLTAQLMALDAVKPGAACAAVDGVARDYIDSCGYKGRFGHGLGHGVGLDIHEAPRLSKSAGEAVLEAGHIVTVEPGSYRPGQDGVRIEDTVLVTESGCRRLTPTSKELIIL
jgi:Xaa-Pro aminopeptidase